MVRDERSLQVFYNIYSSAMTYQSQQLVDWCNISCLATIGTGSCTGDKIKGYYDDYGYSCAYIQGGNTTFDTLFQSLTPSTCRYLTIHRPTYSIGIVGDNSCYEYRSCYQYGGCELRLLYFNPSLFHTCINEWYFSVRYNQP